MFILHNNYFELRDVEIDWLCPFDIIIKLANFKLRRNPSCTFFNNAYFKNS